MRPASDLGVDLLEVGGGFLGHVVSRDLVVLGIELIVMVLLARSFRIFTVILATSVMVAAVAANIAWKKKSV